MRRNKMRKMMLMTMKEEDDNVDVGGRRIA